MRPRGLVASADDPRAPRSLNEGDGKSIGVWARIVPRAVDGRVPRPITPAVWHRDDSPHREGGRPSSTYGEEEKKTVRPGERASHRIEVRKCTDCATVEVPYVRHTATTHRKALSPTKKYRQTCSRTHINVRTRVHTQDHTYLWGFFKFGIKLKPQFPPTKRETSNPNEFERDAFGCIETLGKCEDDLAQTALDLLLVESCQRSDPCLCRFISQPNCNRKV
jgi:hypothetical protein